MKITITLSESYHWMASITPLFNPILAFIQLKGFINNTFLAQCHGSRKGTCNKYECYELKSTDTLKVLSDYRQSIRDEERLYFICFNYLLCEECDINELGLTILKPLWSLNLYCERLDWDTVLATPLHRFLFHPIQFDFYRISELNCKEASV